MVSGVRKTVFLLVAVIAVVLGATTYKYSQKKLLSEEQLKSAGAIIFETPRSFKFEGLVKHNSKLLTKDDFKGRWSLIYFGYTFCPDICPTSLAKINNMDKQLKKEMPELAERMGYMMVTVDPKRDSVDKLKHYLPYFNPYFIGVTGDIKNIYDLTRQFNIAFTPVINTEDEFYLVDHSANLVIINPQGDYHGFIRPPFDPEKLSLVMASVNKLF
ncbi:MAG: SCO family protein [Endozoicomonas sp. (ex Botrylloides leachii)]|nr:SCO family protein [Endozoicomonas sp. (ex Botrylloides leachii)]